MLGVFMEYGEKNVEYNCMFWFKKLSLFCVFIIFLDLFFLYKSYIIVIYCLLRSYLYNNKKIKGKFIWFN